MPTNLTILDAEFCLYEGGALHWPSQNALLVADLHLGKGAAFRNIGQAPIPPGSTEATLKNLSQIVRRLNPEVLYVLGDLWHAASGCDAATMDELGRFISRHPLLKIVLVEGNHDRKAGKAEESLGIERVAELEIGPFLLRHEPEPGDGYVLAGHLHPGVVMSGAGRLSHRFPCLWTTDAYGVLPAFGEFTGCKAVYPNAKDGVWVVTDTFTKEIQPNTHAPRIVLGV